MSVLDRIIGCCALVPLAPFAGILAVLTRLDDGGPALFRQTRIGLRGRPFVIYKFRTMQNQRVTRVGRYLRGCGLDEVAQFINVARGEMAIIGPRPVTAADAVRWGWGQDHPRWKLPPGMASLPAILGTNKPEHAARLDRLYARKKTVTLDLTLTFIAFLMLLSTKRTVRTSWRALRKRWNGRVLAWGRRRQWSDQTRIRNDRSARA